MKKNVLRSISRIYGVPECDIPKTLRRFKKEIEEMEAQLYSKHLRK